MPPPLPPPQDDFTANNEDFKARYYTGVEIPSVEGFVYDPDNPTIQTERLSYILAELLIHLKEDNIKVYQAKGLDRLLIETIQQVCPHVKIRTPYGYVEVSGYE